MYIISYCWQIMINSQTHMFISECLIIQTTWVCVHQVKKAVFGRTFFLYSLSFALSCVSLLFSIQYFLYSEDIEVLICIRAFLLLKALCLRLVAFWKCSIYDILRISFQIVVYHIRSVQNCYNQINYFPLQIASNFLFFIKPIFFNQIGKQWKLNLMTNEFNIQIYL